MAAERDVHVTPPLLVRSTVALAPAAMAVTDPLTLPPPATHTHTHTERERGNTVELQSKNKARLIGKKGWHHEYHLSMR